MSWNVYLHGGGTRLAVHLGALKALEEHNADITAWAGTSAGSLVAAVMACGYSHQAAFELMMETDYRMFLDRSALRMLRNYGLCSGRKFESWLDNVLGGARFKSLDRPFAVVATDVATGNARIFSHDHTPEIKIATAVRCSIGIPGIFGVRRLGAEAFIDGAFAAVDPAELFPNPNAPSAVVRLHRDPAAELPRKRLGLAAYIGRVMEIMLRCADDLCCPEWFTHDLRLAIDHSGPMAFGMAAEEKQQLYEQGYQKSRRMLGESPVELMNGAGLAESVPGAHAPDLLEPVVAGEHASL